MLWKLAVGAMMLPAFLGVGMTAQATTTLQNTSQSELTQNVIEEVPQYYANNYYYKNNCNRGYRQRSGGYYRQNYYRPSHNGYHRQNYYYRPQSNGHKTYRHGYHNNGYHNNGYHNNGYHNNGYHR
ncbi:MAG: hypothetical protein IGS39_24685 [Calothrix sp. C42_A2020_038]|nr:hypothetical protein [Calothrix sp. C42_A2020_038]